MTAQRMPSSNTMVATSVGEALPVMSHASAPQSNGQPVGQLMVQRDMGQPQQPGCAMGQALPMGRQLATLEQEMRQAVPMGQGQGQSMGQALPMGQLQTVGGAQHVGQQPMGQMLPMGQPQQIGAVPQQQPVQLQYGMQPLQQQPVGVGQGQPLGGILGQAQYMGQEQLQQMVQGQVMAHAQFRPPPMIPDPVNQFQAQPLPQPQQGFDPPAEVLMLPPPGPVVAQRTADLYRYTPYRW